MLTNPANIGRPASDRTAADMTIARYGDLRAMPARSDISSLPVALKNTASARNAARFVTPYAAMWSIMPLEASCESSVRTSPPGPMDASAATPMRR